MNYVLHLLFLKDLPVVGEEMEQRGVSLRTAGQHAEDQDQVGLSKVPISLEEGYVQDFFNLKQYNDTLKFR